MTTNSKKHTIEELMEVPIGEAVAVSELPEDDRIAFVQDEENADFYRDMVGGNSTYYDTFFVCIHDGELLFVYGMVGTVPSLWKLIWRVA